MREYIFSYAFCIAIICILLLGVVLQKSVRGKTTKRFLVLMYAALAFLIVNIFSELLEGKAAWFVVSYFFNILSFFAVDFVVVSFCAYLYALLENGDGKYLAAVNLVVLSCFIRAIITVVLTAAGKLFVIEDGYFIEKELGFVPYVVSGMIMLELIIVILINWKCFSKRQLTVILIYELLPVPPIVVEMYTNMYFLTGVAITLSILLIYVLLQTTAMEQSISREALLEKISNTDQLTGLYNRRAFYQKMSELKPFENIGIIFCDINGLKSINDRLGHTAGDEYIKRFSGLMENSLGKENIYRISGDEFVAILQYIPEEIFHSTAEDFHGELKRNDSIAALGATFGTGSCVERLVVEAEEKMYEDKRIYKSSLSR